MLSDKRIYRARDGMILGVCLGLSRAWGLPAPGLRLLMIILVLLTGMLPGIGLYILAAMLMEPEPAVRLENSREAEFYDRFRHSRGSALSELKERITRLDQRLRDMEDKVVRGGLDWEQRFWR